MNTDKNKTTAAFVYLMKVMKDEFVEFNLSLSEINDLYIELLILVLSSKEGTSLDSICAATSEQEIDDAIKSIKGNTLTSSHAKYLKHYFSCNLAIKNILQNFLVKYSFQDLYDNKNAQYALRKALDLGYDDFIDFRSKSSTESGVEWELHPLHNKEPIKVPGAVFVWPEVNGYFWDTCKSLCLASQR